VTAVVLQARLDSSRLPGKSLMPLWASARAGESLPCGEGPEGRPLIFRVMEALKAVRADLYILASPEDCAASFTPLAEEAGFVFCAGPKDDVLGRYCLAIRRFGIEWVIRATGDNPFVFADAACAIAEEARSLKAAYAGYSGLPYGAGVESVAAWALLKADEEAKTGLEREHVCPYLYNHPEIFSLHRPLAPVRWQDPSLRVTVDTAGDYRQAAALYAALSRRVGDQLTAPAGFGGGSRPTSSAAHAGGPLKARYCGEEIIAACKELETQ
jgi:spore coat polysaccharide biosynthesis protein SpsF